MNKITNQINFAEFKVKHRLWLWVIALLWHIIAIRLSLLRINDYWNVPNYWPLIIVLVLDVILIPDASHFRYVINDKFLEIKCVVYPGADILLSSITAVQNATIMTFRGFGVKIYEESFGAYKITYSERRGRLKTVIVTPKNGKKFIEELGLHVEKNVILIDNTESAFKKKKDQK